MPCSGATGAKSYKKPLSSFPFHKASEERQPTFVMITSSSRGSSRALIALPSIISERPLEYDYEQGQIFSQILSHIPLNRTYVRGIESLDPCIVATNKDQSDELSSIGGFAVRMQTHANLICLLTSSWSSMAHAFHPLWP